MVPLQPSRSFAAPRRSGCPVVLLALLLALAGFPATGACRSTPRPSWILDIPDSVVVTTSTVRLSDLARGSVPPEPGMVVVAAGGRPGTVIETTGRAILRRLVMAGQAGGVTLVGADRCRIVFAGNVVPAAQLHRRIGDLLGPHIPEPDPEAPPPWLEIELPATQITAGDQWSVSWPRPRQLQPGRNLVTLAVETANSSQRFSIAAILHAYGRVAVPMQSAARGQPADPAAMQWQWVDLALTSPGLVTDPRALQDMQLARDLVPGQALMQRDLAPRPLVHRGEMIDLVVRRGGVEAVLRVECRQDGLLGQTVSVRNPQNSSLLVARVSGPGTVSMGR